MSTRRASNGEPLRLCFVCMGNICRSPMAEAIMREAIRAAGLSASIEVDSAGTSSWHIGKSPDVRAIAAAQRHGVSMAHRGRQFAQPDFDAFDLVLVMDFENRTELLRLARNGDESARVRLLRAFDQSADGAVEIADPYYGTPDDFDRVFDEIASSCQGLLEQLQAEHLD